jgi:hypothetical protein
MLSLEIAYLYSNTTGNDGAEYLAKAIKLNSTL